MKTLTFQGYSDDTFACAGPGIDVDRDNGGSELPVTMRVAVGDEVLIVVGQYAAVQDCPGWLIGVGPADFGAIEKHIPAWPIRFERSEREYSPRLVIEAPDDVVVTLP